MLSQAGRNYQKMHSSRPLNTPQRIRMYNSMEVAPSHSSRKSAKKSTMETISRQSRDSYLLRYTKQMVVNTNYNLNDQLTHPTAHKQKFSTMKFKRIIGNIRDQDFSLPLLDNCDHRCAKAMINLPYQSTIVSTRNTHKVRQQHHNLSFQKQLSRKSLVNNNSIQNLKKHNSNFSTLQTDGAIEENSLIYKRKIKKQAIDKHKALMKVRKFQDNIGHRYGQEIFKPKQIPDFYDIQSANQSIVKKSMSSPKGNVKFDKYRDQIRTRIDRQDPHWSMTINYEGADYNPETLKTVNLDKISPRKLNQVYSKYPIRQSMNLRIPDNK